MLKKFFVVSSVVSLMAAFMVLLTGCPAVPDVSNPAGKSISFVSVVQDQGISLKGTTLGLILTFDKVPTGLTIDNVAVTGADKADFVGDTTGVTRTIPISNITVANGANVTIQIQKFGGFTVKNAVRTAKVYKTISKSCVGEWLFSNNANDTSAYANHGSLNGNATYTADRKSTANSALILDGNGDYVSVNDADLLDLQFDFSVSLWIKSDGVQSSGAAGLFSKYHTNSANGLFIRAANNTDLKLLVGATNSFTTADDYLTAATWNHFVITYDFDKNSGTEPTAMIYKNGVLKETKNLAGSALFVQSNTNMLAFGVDFYNGGVTDRYYKGALDDIRVYTGILSDLDVQGLYND
jgi:hypothetical protein